MGCNNKEEPRRYIVIHNEVCVQRLNIRGCLSLPPSENVKSSSSGTTTHRESCIAATRAHIFYIARFTIARGINVMTCRLYRTLRSRISNVHDSVDSWRRRFDRKKCLRKIRPAGVGGGSRPSVENGSNFPGRRTRVGNRRATIHCRPSSTRRAWYRNYHTIMLLLEYSSNIYFVFARRSFLMIAPWAIVNKERSYED